MKLQVLVSAMNIKNIKEFISDINLKTSAIIINQCDKNFYEEYDNIKIYSFNEKGVGLSRNSALMRSNGDIVLIADDDVRYVDNYEEIIIEEFKRNPKADMIVFNLQSENKERPLYDIKKVIKLSRFNCLKYGACRYAIKLDKLKEKNIYFSLLFGGGAKYGSGEDSIFIHDCVKKGLKVYTSTKLIACVKQDTSTWFNGYNSKFFYDKGYLYKNLYGRLRYLMSLQFLIRHYKITKENGFLNSMKNMIFLKKEGE